MIDETTDSEESFAALFEESLKTERRTVHPGEKVTGRIVQIGAERAIVDLGDGIDGMIDLGELSEKGEALTAKKGDSVEAYVLKMENRMAVLTRTLGKGAGGKLALEDAHRTGIPIEGLVAEVNKGGYVIEIAGIRCFCPMGQMDVRRIEDPKTMIGQRLFFRVRELKGGRDAVLSRRTLQEQEQAGRAAKTREQLKVGAKFTGTVTSVRDFGAFVDIGGMEGLVPVSELGYGRARPAEIVSVGQSIEVAVLRIEPPGPKDRSERLTLSVRSLAEDPWDRTVAELPVGAVVRGTVVRIQPFGAFVEIVPGVDGLLHVSAFGRRVGSPSEVVRVGETIAVAVDSIDTNQRRISLSYVDPSELVEASVEGEAPPQVANEPGAARRTAATNPLAGMRIRQIERSAKAPAPATSPQDPAAAKPRVLSLSSPTRDAGSSSAVPQVGQVVEVTVDKIESFGLLVKWATHRGLVPASELETPKNADLKKAFPLGTHFKAVITEARGDGKVRLSAKLAAQEEERAEARDWMKSQGAPTKGFGTLGDLLKRK